MLGKQVHIARVEPLGFAKERLAPVPLASPPRDIGQRLRNGLALLLKFVSACRRLCSVRAALALRSDRSTLPLVTSHMSHVTCHLSLVTCHLSLVTCHLSLVTCLVFGAASRRP